MMIQRGAPVFYADNSVGAYERCVIFSNTIISLGLVPFFYCGAGVDMRESTQAAEIERDFERAHAVVLYFGAPKPNSNNENHWALSALRHIGERGVDVLVYVSNPYPVAILRKCGYNGEPRIITDDAAFASLLRMDLREIIILQ